jgi:hypothetical protein
MRLILSLYLKRTALACYHKRILMLYNSELPLSLSLRGSSQRYELLEAVGLVYARLCALSFSLQQLPLRI